MGWWKSKAPETPCRVVFFQVDLAGHSGWIESEGIELKLARERNLFADKLRNSLKTFGFDNLHWLGDGGLFALEYTNCGDAHKVFDAADKAFGLFSKWKKPGWGIELRASAAFVAHVIVYPDSGNWCSSRMNAFLKYERALSLPNAFVITDDLRRVMDPSFGRMQSLTGSYKVLLPAEKITMWQDSQHLCRVTVSTKRFSAWLSAKRDPEYLPACSIKAPAPHAYGVGEVLVLDTALDVTGYDEIKLIQSELEPAEAVIQAVDRGQWASQRDSLVEKGAIGAGKPTVSRFIPEASDDPVARLHWSAARYEEAKAFNLMLEEDGTRKIRLRYFDRNFEILAKETRTLGLLGNFVIVLTKNPNHGRDIVIAHRTKGERPGGFFNNCWSFSIEEQFRPVQTVRGGKVYEADPGIKEGILRGVREELLGDLFTSPIIVSVHAFVMEAINLNYAFLSVADLPETTFQELVNLWPGAESTKEHDAIAALPMKKETLLACLKSEALPADIWEQMEKSGVKLESSDHRWHPASPVRIALASWFLENVIGGGR